RLGQAALVVALVVSSCFVIVRLAPGDPFAQQLEGQDVAPEVRERLRAAYGLDRTVPEQFVRFVRSALRGELGYSELRKRDVRRVLAQTLPNTLLLMGT